MFNVAVIGCGRIAWLLENDPLRYKPCTHLGALKYWRQRDKRIRFSAFCDADVLRAEAAATFARSPDALITTDYRQVFAAKPDLLVIASSTNTHGAMLSAALRSSIRRIVLEKPVAFSAAEAQKLRRLIAKSRSVVLPNYERRYHLKYQKLKSQITDVSASYRGFFAAGGSSLYANKNGDEGVLLHDTTHLLDLAQFYFGKIKKHQAICGRRKHVLYLEHAGGASGVIETSLGVGAFHLELEIHTNKERLVLGNGFITRAKISESPHYRNLRSYAEPVWHADSKFAVSKNPFVQLYEKALYGKPNNAHFMESLENVEILSLL